MNDYKLKPDKCFFSLYVTKIQSYSKEITAFMVIFFAIFTSMKISNFTSEGNVEQWLNLSGNVFSGNQDFLFSFGPLFWLIAKSPQYYNNFAYISTVAFFSLSNALLWTLILSQIHRTKNYLLFALCFIIFIKNINTGTAFFMWPLALVCCLDFSANPMLKRRKSILIFSAILIAFTFYIRYFFGFCALLTMGSYLFSRAIADRRISELFYFCLAVVVAYLLFGAIFFHNYASILDYLKVNSEISFGNSVDMVLNLENTNLTFICAFIILLTVDLFLIINKRYTLLLTVSLLWLVLLKLGFSRADHFMGYFVIPSTLLSLVILFETGVIAKLLFIISMIAMYLICAIPTYPGAVTSKLFSNLSDYKEDYITRLSQVYTQYQLDTKVVRQIGHSSIDVYPYNNEYIVANKLNYWHRPLFQNYMTLTPKLDAMNAEFFYSENKPEYLLWTAGVLCHNSQCNPFDAADRKHVLNEDPLTSESILYNYHPVTLTAGRQNIPLVLFKRNQHPVNKSVMVLQQSQYQFGQWIPIPQQMQVIKIKPEFQFTLLGKLRNMLFRGGIIKLQYQLASGEIKSYRINLLNAVSGIWASLLPSSLNQQGIIADKVVAIRFTSETSHYLTHQFKAKMISINLPYIYPKPSLLVQSKVSDKQGNHPENK